MDYPAQAPDGQGSATSRTAQGRGRVDDASGPSGPPGPALEKKWLKITPGGQKAIKPLWGGGAMRREAYRDLWDVDDRLDRIEGGLVDLGPELEAWVFADDVWGVVGQLREVADLLSLKLSAPGTEKAQVR